MNDDPNPMLIASTAMLLLIMAVFFTPSERLMFPTADKEVLKDALAPVVSRPAHITSETDPMRLARSGRMTVRVTAKILDSNGMLLPGHKVNFKVTSGPGAIDPPAETTDAVGQVQAVFVPWNLEIDEITIVRACVNGSALCAFSAIDPTEY